MVSAIQQHLQGLLGLYIDHIGLCNYHHSVFPTQFGPLLQMDFVMKKSVLAAIFAVCTSSIAATTIDTRSITEVLAAAKRGDTKSQALAGWMYATGEGTQQNYREAYRWLTKAAEKGNAEAQFNLGVMYENGFLVQQNYQDAARLYRQAALQDHYDAIKRLSSLYITGKIPMDMAESKRWFDKGLAMHQMDPEADFAKAVSVVGTKICAESNGDMNQYAGYAVNGVPQYRQVPGVITITGFTEGFSGRNLQIRVASIKHRDSSPIGRESSLIELNYNDATIRPNSVFWDDLRNWKPC